MDIQNQSPLYRNDCRTYWTQLLRTGSQPSRHPFWVSGVGDIEAEPAPAPRLPCHSIMPSPPKIFGLGTEPTRSQWPRTPRAAHAPPGRPRLAPSSGGPVRPVPAGSPIPQAAVPPVASTVALDRPGASRGGTGPARLTARRPLTHPQPQPPRPAHNIRPAFRLRHPSRAKPRARSLARRSSNRARAYTETSTGPCCQKTLPRLPPRYSPLFRLKVQLFPIPHLSYAYRSSSSGP